MNSNLSVSHICHDYWLCLDMFELVHLKSQQTSVTFLTCVLFLQNFHLDTNIVSSSFFICLKHFSSERCATSEQRPFPIYPITTCALPSVYLLVFCLSSFGNVPHIPYLELVWITAACHCPSPCQKHQSLTCWRKSSIGSNVCLTAIPSCTVSLVSPLERCHPHPVKELFSGFTENAESCDCSCLMYGQTDATSPGIIPFSIVKLQTCN